MRNYMEEYQRWLDSPALSNAEWEELNAIRDDKKEIESRFFAPLEFGTAGLRGEMALGCRRMNIHVIRHATQAFAEVIKAEGESACARGIAICFDCRVNSERFAHEAAGVMAANGIHVRIFDALRPTPELSFAVKHYGTTAGLNITASHNPKEYNGYKAYWNDGAQVVAPHDKNIIAEVQKITSPDQVLTNGHKDNIVILDETFDAIYLDAVHSLSLSPEAIAAHHDLKIVYTPIHGTGVILVPESLRKFGFTNVVTVKEQNIPDGNFPTVASPNPEERATMKMAIDLAARQQAEIVLATDPDADRIGMALRDRDGSYILLNGNQTCALLVYYIVRRWSELGKLHGREYIVKTIVTTELVARIAESFGVKHFECLTGFKYIATVIRNLEGKMQYVCGGEESFGFLAEDFVRDKDAVSACSLAAEAAAWAKSQGMTLYDLLKEIYVKYGFFDEALVSIVRQGKEGQEEIARMMTQYRNNPVITVKDYLTGESLDVKSGRKTPIDMEKSNVLQFITADSTIVSIRPSGTEPKIKFYFGVRGELCCEDKFEETRQTMERKIESIKQEMKLI